MSSRPVTNVRLRPNRTVLGASSCAGLTVSSIERSRNRGALGRQFLRSRGGYCTPASLWSKRRRRLTSHREVGLRSTADFRLRHWRTPAAFEGQTAKWPYLRARDSWHRGCLVLAHGADTPTRCRPGGAPCASDSSTIPGPSSSWTALKTAWPGLAPTRPGNARQVHLVGWLEPCASGSAPS